MTSVQQEVSKEETTQVTSEYLFELKWYKILCYRIASKSHSVDSILSSCVVIRNASSFVLVFSSSWDRFLSWRSKSCQWRIFLKSFSVKYTPFNFLYLQWCTLDIVRDILACTFYQMPLFLVRIWNKSPVSARIGIDS